jgi:hypothetical protein
MMAAPPLALSLHVARYLANPYSCAGFPYAEPGFATILPASGSDPGSGGPSPSSRWRRHVNADSSTPCLHGVLHRVTQQEWQLIKASEGVLGSDTSSVGYQVCLRCVDRWQRAGCACTHQCWTRRL